MPPTLDIDAPSIDAATDTAEPVTSLRPERPAWWDQALCNDGRGTMVALFFSDHIPDITAAKAFCAQCPVKDACLTEALARREPWGVWGGELLVNGRILAVKRRRGRPPKQPRPELVVDELGRLLDPSVA
jgi:WhiB family transcriptional regulator, redox-sensing transcriptional regulator